MNRPVKAAITDYGICNMFSVKHACAKVGMEALITSDWKEIQAADVVILPGVGAFGDAMEALKKLDLVLPLRELAQSGKLFVGICLGFQLLLSESEEFGRHEGLGIVPGSVLKFVSPQEKELEIKVPHVGWNQISLPKAVSWDKTPLTGTRNGTFVYFCHSYYADPQDPAVVLTRTSYGPYDYASGLRYKNVYGFQFHPEKSGPVGIQMYQNIAALASLRSSSND